MPGQQGSSPAPPHYAGYSARQAYRKKREGFQHRHADRPSPTEKSHGLAKIDEAYWLLSDPTRRRNYTHQATALKQIQNFQLPELDSIIASTSNPDVYKKAMRVWTLVEQWDEWVMRRVDDIGFVDAGTTRRVSGPGPQL